MMRSVLLLALLSIPLPALAQVSVQFSVPGIRVVGPPPPARVEVQLARPSPNHIWIGGHYAWRGGAHVWIGGHWALPPQPGYVWEPARWVNQNGSWMYYEGHWRLSAPPQPTVVYEPPPQPAQPVEVDIEPPAPIVETRPAVPFGGAVWIGGHWYWNGARHVWIGGHWSAPRQGHRWEEGRWEHGPRGHWVWRSGRWYR